MNIQIKMHDCRLLKSEELVGIFSVFMLIVYESSKFTTFISTIFDVLNSAFSLLKLFGAVARTLIGGGGVYIHIFGFCPTDFF